MPCGCGGNHGNLCNQRRPAPERRGHHPRRQEQRPAHPGGLRLLPRPGGAVPLPGHRRRGHGPGNPRPPGLPGLAAGRPGPGGRLRPLPLRRPHGADGRDALLGAVPGGPADPVRPGGAGGPRRLRPGLPAHRFSPVGHGAAGRPVVVRGGAAPLSGREPGRTAPGVSAAPASGPRRTPCWRPWAAPAPRSSTTPPGSRRLPTWSAFSGPWARMWPARAPGG